MILQIGALTDMDGANVTPKHCVMPDIHIFFQRHIAGNDGCGGDFTLLHVIFLLMKSVFILAL
jgi:hypothetical protein